LPILRNDLRRTALKQHAAEVNNATPERKLEILAQSDKDIQQELRKRAIRIRPKILFY